MLCARGRLQLRLTFFGIDVKSVLSHFGVFHIKLAKY